MNAVSSPNVVDLPCEMPAPAIAPASPWPRVAVPATEPAMASASIRAVERDSSEIDPAAVTFESSMEATTR